MNHLSFPQYLAHNPCSKASGEGEGEGGHTQRLRHLAFEQVLTSLLLRARQSCAQAERLILNTGSITILGYAHNSVDQSAMELWNSEESKTRDPDSSEHEWFIQESAIQRWENEGGVLCSVIQSGRKSL